jgi:hypothetical protein
VTVNFLTKNFNSDLEFHLLEQGGRVWIRLTSRTFPLEAYWSIQGNRENVDWEYALALIELRLQRFERREVSLDEAIEVWPSEWDYWGRGIPGPIAEYFSY